MNTRTPLGCLIALLGGLAASGCIASPGDETTLLDEPERETTALTQNALTQNALTQNALTQNALTQNALTQNALTQNALTQNALTQNALTQNALEDPNAREVFRYIVSCALPAGQAVTFTASDGQSYDFPGEIGVAPAWGQPGGKCDEGCQQWVSACVISRLDYLGEHVTISVRGGNPALAIGWNEYVNYTRREATYFGNLFSATPRYLACLPPGQTQDPRVCGPSTAGCAVQFVGSCDKVCQGQGWNGAYYNCRGPSDSAEYPSGTTTYFGDVTVYLP